MNNGRGWRGGGGGPWDRGGPPGFRPPPPPLFRAGFPPRPFFAGPGGPPPWRAGPGGPPGGGRRGGYVPRGGINKRFQKFGSGGRAGGGGKPAWRNGGGVGAKRERPKETPGRRLAEDEIGVTEYMSDHPGFNGIIKSRYSDFQVNEIDEKGRIAKLTDLDVPDPPKREEIHEDEELLLSKYNLELLPTETWDKINSLAIATLPTTDRVEVDVTGLSKDHRTKVHDAVKKAFGDAIVGSTVTTNDKKLVRFEKYRKGVRIDNRVKWVWPGEYVHFIVHKENCDTMDAAGKIAERLMMSNVKPSMLGYSGTKDRRAKSSQWFSLRKTEPRRISNACRNLREIHVGNFSFSDTHLKLGMLSGNRFRIALRNVTADDALVEEACIKLRENGFINYYGLQRFGTRVDTPTYQIGLALLQGNFRDAIDKILEPRAGPMQQCLDSYKATKDARVAIKHLRRNSFKTLEGRLIRALAKEPNDLVGGLNRLARNTRLLYVHSYQSLIWNRCVSKRIKDLGLQPAVGDLVLENPVDLEETDHDASHDYESDDEDSATEDKSKSDDVTESSPETTKSSEETPTEEDKPTNGNAVEKDENNERLKPKVPVKVLTQEDIDSGKYSITDIILPLPGYNVDYPPNLKEYYEELLTKDGVTLELRHKIKNYSMTGAYRHIVVHPKDLEWECVRYTHPFGDLIKSDLDELNKTELTTIIPDGKYKALIVSMSLPASCYATMALRELMKVDTSCDKQAHQNNYYKEDVKTEDCEAEVKKEDDSEVKEKSSETSDLTEASEPSSELSEAKANGNGEAKRKLEESEEDADSKKLKTGDTQE